MTTVKSLASTKSTISAALDTFAVATGHAIRDLVSAGFPKDHPVLASFRVAVDGVIRMEADSVLAYVPEKTDAPTFDVQFDGKGTDLRKPISGDPVNSTILENKVQPAGNDITALRNRFMIELTSQKRMSRKDRMVKGIRIPGAESFIGPMHATVIGSLLHDGLIREVNVGRGVFLAPVEKEVKPIIPAPTVPPAVIAAVLAPVASEDIPAGFDNANEVIDNGAAGAPSKPESALDELCRKHDEMASLREEAKRLNIKGAHLYKDVGKLRAKIAEAKKSAVPSAPKSTPPAPVETRPTLADAVAVVKAKQAPATVAPPAPTPAVRSNDDIMADVQRLTDSLILNPEKHLQIDKLVKAIRAIACPAPVQS